MRFIVIIILSSFCFGNLIKPENAQELNYIHILFEWEQEPDAVSYNLQVSDSLSFNNLTISVWIFLCSLWKLLNFGKNFSA